MKDKYNLNFPIEVITKNVARLTNQLWKLIPMRENNEDWQKQLGSVLNELYGLQVMFGDHLNFLILLSKLEGLPQTKDFMVYRIAVFSAISLLTEIANSLNE